MSDLRQRRGVPFPAIIPWLLAGSAIGLIVNLALVAATPYGTWLQRHPHPFGLEEPFNSVRLSALAAVLLGASIFGRLWPRVRRRIG